MDDSSKYDIDDFSKYAPKPTKKNKIVLFNKEMFIHNKKACRTPVKDLPIMTEATRKLLEI